LSKDILGPYTTFTVNGTDLSQWCHACSIEDTRNQVDVTGFGEAFVENINGLRTAQVTASFWQDYVAGGPDATLQPLYANQTVGTVKITPNTQLTGSSAVVYTLTTKLSGWSPVTGSPGDAPSTDVTFVNSGTVGMQRGTV
jgi:hypothetical protein